MSEHPWVNRRCVFCNTVITQDGAIWVDVTGGDICTSAEDMGRGEQHQPKSTLRRIGPSRYSSEYHRGSDSGMFGRDY